MVKAYGHLCNSVCWYGSVQSKNSYSNYLFVEMTPDNVFCLAFPYLFYSVVVAVAPVKFILFY